ncbi:hypothetical protein MMC25_002695 [Agyrium rufum]|nr:hypothetical protein [Agyrium rufum]
MDLTANRGTEAFVISTAFTAIAAFFVFLRIWTRLGIVRNTGWDDWVICASLGFSAALTYLIWAQVRHGMGHHFNTLADGEFEQMLKPFWASIIVYNLALTATKLSILLQYLRVFPSLGMRRAIFVSMGIIIVYGTWTFFASVFTCVPVAAFWDKSIEGARCFNTMAYWFSNAALNIVTDIIILTLPIPALRSLRLPRKQKYGLIGIFGVGFIIVVTSILRLHALYHISISTDITFDNPPAATWSSVEANIGIICSSLPTLKALLSKIFPRLLSSSNPRSGDRIGRSGLSGSRSNGRRVSSNKIAGPRVHSHVKSNVSAGVEKDFQLQDWKNGRLTTFGAATSASSSSDEIESARDAADQNGIKVVTVVAQEVEPRDDSESERHLVWKEIEGGVKY